MTPRAFLPDYSQMPWNGRFRPLFRLFAGESWRMVRAGGAPVECETAAAAVTAAKAHVERILNPKLRSETMEPANDALSEEVREFLARRDGEAAEERKRVFGADCPSTVYLRGGRTVAVEMKRRRSA